MTTTARPSWNWRTSRARSRSSSPSRRRPSRRPAPRRRAGGRGAEPGPVSRRRRRLPGRRRATASEVRKTASGRPATATTTRARTCSRSEGTPGRGSLRRARSTGDQTRQAGPATTWSSTPTWASTSCTPTAGQLVRASRSNEAVTAGQQLCRAGMTGDATGPHLHFEMWAGRLAGGGGQPDDPLPYLEAWEPR